MADTTSMENDIASESPNETADVPRRGFLSLSSLAMTGGLAAGYGMLGILGGRYFFPSEEGSNGWLFVAPARELKLGESLVYESPVGATVVIARRSEGDTAEDFIALSSVCPHLGCQVHWEPQNERFFCPCHNGAFDPGGRPIAGPPAAANQPLKQFPLRVQNELLFVEVPLKPIL